MKITRDTVILETEEEKYRLSSYKLAYEGLMNEYINLEYDPQYKDDFAKLQKKKAELEKAAREFEKDPIVLKDLTPDQVEEWQWVKLEIEMKNNDHSNALGGN